MSRISFDEQAKQNINKLLDYASKKLYLDDFDKIYVQNQLLDLFLLTEPSESPVKPYELYATLAQLTDYAVRKKIIRDSEKLNFETKIMGLLTPAPSKVVEMFDDIAYDKGTEQACKFLFKLGEDNTYLRRPDLDKNIVWTHEAPRGNIIVTINLAKPEKTPEQVRLAKLAKGGYPKCMLCAENLGWAGNAAKPARQTLRTIPFELFKEPWFLQYSPYQYFDEHVIAVSGEHRPMCVTEASFRRMVDFVDLFPHYFIGSNAALPIVGGSILAHDHYQGGKKVLPVFGRPSHDFYRLPGCPDVHISIVDWYNSIVRIESKSREQAIIAADKMRVKWEGYSDESQNILAYTMSGGEKTQHNAVTPIVSKTDDGEYQINLILRNNRTDDAHPFGIFHPAPELHNIKQEAIGIIEVMGLFILPGRLQQEAVEIRNILTGKTPLDFRALADDKHPLHKHLAMITQLVVDHGTECSDKKAGDAVTAYINTACERILDTTAVFKNTDQGRSAFAKFLTFATTT